MPATLILLSIPVPADCRRPLSTVRVEPFREPERAPLVSQAPLVERDRQRAVHVGVEQTDDGAALASPGLGLFHQPAPIPRRRWGSATPSAFTMSRASVTSLTIC